MNNRKKPPWLKVKSTMSDNYRYVEDIINQYNLHTVCQSAACPNQCECFSRKTATFMIMGNTCTRNCRFCNIEHEAAEPLDPAEPKRVAEACALLTLRHCVITSVTRDDLDDGGAYHFAATIRAVKKAVPGIIVEVLIPDFKGVESSLETVLKAGPFILNHNLETVQRLYPQVRPQAVYSRSIALLRLAKEISPEAYTKSGLMLGLGETRREVLNILEDLREAECNLLTIGQYLSPSKAHFPEKEYVHPDTFRWYEAEAMKMGFTSVAAGPLVRSSYNAESFFKTAQRNNLEKVLSR